MSDDLVRITVSDGKYTFVQRADGSCYALRYDEPWREEIFDGMALAMAHRIEELEAKLAKADKLASEFKNCLEVLTKEDDYVCCSGHQCGCYGASLHAQAIYYANEAIDDYHKTTGGKDE